MSGSRIYPCHLFYENGDLMHWYSIQSLINKRSDISVEQYDVS